MSSENMTTTLAGYETTIVTRTELSDQALKELKDRISSFVSQFKGEVVLTEDWGKRKLAHPIENETRGTYTHLVYSGLPGVVSEVERNLRIHEHVLRYLTVQIEREFNIPEYLKKKTALREAKEAAPS